jgi:hypothetical protein
VIEQNHVRRDRSGSARDFLQFAFADQGCGVGTVFALRELARNLRTRARRQIPQFVERFLATEVRSIRRQ